MATSPRDRALAGVLFYAGARTSEAVGLDVDDARLSARKGVLRILGKGVRVREVPIQEVEHLHRPERCPTCAHLAREERVRVAEFADRVREQAHTEPSPTLCVLHLAAVLAAGPGADQGRRLVRSLSGVLARASEDMRTFALKRESLRRGMLTDEEHRAHRLTLALLAGHPDLVRPWKVRDE